MAPGETRAISLGTDVIATVTAADGTQIPITIPLPPVVVAAAHLLDLDPTSQTVQAGNAVTYNVLVKNPLATSETFTLSTVDLDGLGVALAAAVNVAAGQMVSVPLQVTVPAGTSSQTRVFSVFAQTAAGALDAVEGELIILGGAPGGGGGPPHVDLNTLAVDVALTPSQGTAGQGTPATYKVIVTNVGDAVDTYTLSGSFPAGFTATFAEPTVTVPPGLSNFREVLLMLTPPPGTSAGDKFLCCPTKSEKTDWHPGDQPIPSHRRTGGRDRQIRPPARAHGQEPHRTRRPARTE